MYKFSEASHRKLMTCDPRLITLCQEVIKYVDCTVLHGTRSKTEQDRLYAEGKSKVQYPRSKHNSFPSMAVDLAPYPIDWNNTKRFYWFAGIVMGIAHRMNIPIRWGGDWDMDNDLDDQNFNDLVHFEIKE